MSDERDALSDIMLVTEAWPDALPILCYWIREARSAQLLERVATQDRDHWRRRLREVEAVPREDAAELAELREENRRLLQRVTELEAVAWSGGGVVYTQPLDATSRGIVSSSWEGEGPEDAS